MNKMAFSKLMMIYLTPIAPKLFVLAQNNPYYLCAKFHVHQKSFGTKGKYNTVSNI